MTDIDKTVDKLNRIDCTHADAKQAAAIIADLQQKLAIQEKQLADMRMLVERNYPTLTASGLCSKHQPDLNVFSCGTCYPSYLNLCDAHNELKQKAWNDLRILSRELTISRDYIDGYRLAETDEAYKAARAATNECGAYDNQDTLKWSPYKLIYNLRNRIHEKRFLANPFATYIAVNEVVTLMDELESALNNNEALREEVKAERERCELNVANESPHPDSEELVVLKAKNHKRILAAIERVNELNALKEPQCTQ